MHKRQRERVCKNCSDGFMFKLSQLKHYKGGGQFCSRKCHYAYYLKNPTERPGFKKDKYDQMGYRLVQIPGVKVVREHRFIMEKHLGRKLLRNEHVHHINGKKDDNRLENLIVLTASQHHKEHFEENREMYIEAGRKGLAIARRILKERKGNRWSFEYDCCIVCHLVKYKHQGNGKCSKCYLSEYRMSQKTTNK